MIGFACYWRKSCGLLFVELMVVIAIVGIVFVCGSYIYSQYSQYSNRTLVKEQLQQYILVMERLYNQTGKYLSQDDTWPAIIESNFIGVGGVVYTISFQPGHPNNNQQSFSIVAIPVAGSLQASDVAGNLCINQTGLIIEHASKQCNTEAWDISLCSGGTITAPAKSICAYDNCSGSTICGSCVSATGYGSCSGSYIGGACDGNCDNGFIAGNCNGNCSNSVVCGVCSGNCNGVTQTGC